ncbi:MAG: hypothetical protein ACOH1Y_11725 [Propionicimonas sp.]
MDFVVALGSLTTMATHLIQTAALVGAASIVINVLAATVRTTK